MYVMATDLVLDYLQWSPGNSPQPVLYRFHNKKQAAAASCIASSIFQGRRLLPQISGTTSPPSNPTGSSAYLGPRLAAAPPHQLCRRGPASPCPSSLRGRRRRHLPGPLAPGGGGGGGIVGGADVERGGGGGGGEGALVLGELVQVGVLAEHVDYLSLGAGGEELELGGGVRVGVAGGKRAEVGDGVAAVEALRGHVVGARRVGFPREGAQPHALVPLVDLRAPQPVGLRHHALVPR
ncbi:unnamed protein product [Urochloa humidicola]